MSDLKSAGFPTNVNKLKLADLLAIEYPGYHWDNVFLLRGRYAQQKRFERAIASLFEVHKNTIVSFVLIRNIKGPSHSIQCTKASEANQPRNRGLP